ncbi:MAG: SpoIIE family protein phosphatase [Lachnospiraceae bacterium]|nr:SpoIIE family protein phosphatase [Lachnospiraceae bacterium]
MKTGRCRTFLIIFAFWLVLSAQATYAASLDNVANAAPAEALSSVGSVADSATDANTAGASTVDTTTVDAVKATKIAASEEENWSFVLYNNNEGMPFSEANMLQQTRDGFIYIGCYGGLLRYDGKEFYRYEDPRLLNIIALYADSRDRLWFATNSNGFGYLENGAFTFYGSEEGLETQFVCCFAEDENGNILVGTVENMYYVDQEDALHKMEDPLLAGINVDMLQSDERGMIYGLTRNAEVFAIKDLSVTAWYDRGQISTETVTCIYPDPENQNYLYMGLDTGGLEYVNIFPRRKTIKYIPTPDLVYINGLLYVDERLWIASDMGIAFIDKDNTYQRPDKMQRSNSSQYIMSDLEGNIWIASDRLGVIKLSPSIFCNINGQANLPDMVVNATYVQDDILYIGSDTGLICLDKNYNEAQTPVSDLLRETRIRCIQEDGNGSLWFCTYSDSGLVRLNEDGSIRTYTTNDGFASNSVREINEMSDGTLVVSVKGGIYFIKDGEITQSFTEGDGLVNPQTLTTCEYRSGTILFGTDGNGIYLISDGKIKTFPPTKDLSSSVIMRIRKNERQRSWWIISTNSLYVLRRGELTEIHNLQNQHNYDVEFDENGDAWLLASDGIYVGNADDILAGKEVRYIHYDYKSGLPFAVTPHCRNYVSDNGALYMSGNDGVVKISVNSAFEQYADVQLTIPYIEVNNETVYLAEDDMITLPARTKKLWVHPFALSYSLAEPVVAYELEGFDEELNVSSRSELPSIIYTNLKGGSYTFRFALLDSVTGEITKEITIPIVKRKALHERILFWLLLAGALSAAILSGTRLYVSRKARELAAEHEQDRIRTELSVARDIQNSMLPRIFPAFPDRTEIDLYASMTPAKEVAGDFYDFFLIDDDHLALIIADVSGKGVGPALFMMVAKNTLKNCAMTGKLSSPGEILSEANNKLCKDNEALLFVTVWFGILTLSTGRLVSANGGHEYPVLYRKEDGYTLLKDKHGLALGIMEDVVYKETEGILRKGDGVFVYTDGVPEATNANTELFGIDRMVEALNRYAGKRPEEVLKGVHAAVDEFVGEAPQFDDLTMLGIIYNG